MRCQVHRLDRRQVSRVAHHQVHRQVHGLDGHQVNRLGCHQVYRLVRGQVRLGGQVWPTRRQ